MTNQELRIRLLVKQEEADDARSESIALQDNVQDEQLLNYFASIDAALLNLSQAYRLAGYCLDGMMDREACEKMGRDG
jgi:hypothetical protein